MPRAETAFDARAFREVAKDLCVSAAFADGDVAVEMAKKNIEALEREAAEKHVALYKVEVQFGSKHHVDGQPTYGMLTLWESGTKLHGGGDALLYICPGKEKRVSNCEGVIPDTMLGRAVVVCPHCLTAWPNTQLIGQIYYRLPIQKWAEVVHRWFVRLNMNADIRVKYFYQDIRVASEKEQAKELRGELLESARSQAQRVSRVYPLENIIKDVSAGADMYNRILAFMRM
jgi:hypothetical protein